MSVIVLVRDIVVIAKMIQNQVALVHSNNKKLQELATTMGQVISSLEGLSTLPDSQQFINTLTALQRCLQETNNFIQSLSRQLTITKFFNASKNARQIDAFKQSIFELLPVLTIGLSAQNLMDRARDRKADEDARREMAARMASLAGHVRARAAPSAAPQRSPSPTGEDLYQSGTQAHEAGNLSAARVFFERSSKKNYPKSYTSLGLFKLDGMGGLPVDKKGAIQYLEKGAQGGHARAMFNLGRIYEKGDTEQGVVDYQTALFWYSKAYAADPTDTRAREKIDLLTSRAKSTNLDSDYRYYSKR